MKGTRCEEWEGGVPDSGSLKKSGRVLSGEEKVSEGKKHTLQQKCFVNWCSGVGEGCGKSEKLKSLTSVSLC